MLWHESSLSLRKGKRLDQPKINQFSKLAHRCVSWILTWHICVDRAQRSGTITYKRQGKTLQKILSLHGKIPVVMWMRTCGRTGGGCRETGQRCMCNPKQCFLCLHSYILYCFPFVQCSAEKQSFSFLYHNDMVCQQITLQTVKALMWILSNLLHCALSKLTHAVQKKCILMHFQSLPSKPPP